jgi:DNA-directed RNA polymerase subunit RPC12/RpoP
MGTVKVDAYKCERCGHVWIPRDREKRKRPIACAKCKSAYWDTPRKK